MGRTPDNEPDELVAGKYRLVRKIGQGGMGSVWEGEHISLGTQVAIKFIERELAESEEARERFDKEARAAARIQSRYVVGVHDHGVMPDGRPFIVMEYLRGESLENRVVACGRLDLVEMGLIISQVARGLAKAHEMGIVHRDLKPENIFLTESPDDDERVAKIVDFGIAKFAEGTPLGMSSATRTGTILGTPVYMSPEQARGLRDIDHRSDLWALGVVVYRCVVGALPFEGQAVGDIVVKICTQDPEKPSRIRPDLPLALDDWFFRCVAREREKRFSSVRDLAAELLMVAGVISHLEQAFPLSSAASGPGLPLQPSPVAVPAISSSATIENAATQIGTTSSVPRSAKRLSNGLLAGVVVLGMLLLVGSLVVWRLIRPAQEAVLAVPSQTAVPPVSILAVSEPPVLVEASASSSPESLEVGTAPIEAEPEPSTEVLPVPSRGGARQQPSTTGVKPRNSVPKPPATSTEPIELGY